MHRTRSIAHHALALRTTAHRHGALRRLRYLSSASSTSEPSPPNPPISDSPHHLSSTIANPTTTDIIPTVSSGIIPTVSDTLLSLHETLSLSLSTPVPWIPFLSLTALATRLITFPLIYHSDLHHSRAAGASPELRKFQAYLRTAPGSVFQKFVSYRRLRAIALRSAGTSPARLLPYVPAANAAILITASLAVRRIAADPPAAWAAAGPGPPLFLDLAAPDPTGALPLAATALWLYTAQGRVARMADASSAAPDAATDKKKPRGLAALFDGEAMTIGLQALPIFAFPFVQYAPSGMFVFWITSSILTIAQRTALRSESFRAAVGLPTSEEIRAAVASGGPQALKAASAAVGDARRQLEWVQAQVLAPFAERAARECGDELRRDVNAALVKARRTGKISLELEAVVRVDEDTGREYIGVVRKGKK